MFTKAFRLFVSSTFKDFGEERSLLQDKIFPGLESYCAARSFNFRAIDMRWGVNEEAQRDQRTAEICLDEVRAAKNYPAPNFLLLIGDRRGWIPLPYAVAREEFEAATDWLAENDPEAAEELRRVYKLDENHLIEPGLAEPLGVQGSRSTAAYTLRSREDDLVDLKDAEMWEKVEARLRAALQAAATHLHEIGRLHKYGRQKYFLSLTEQEVFHGLPGIRKDGRVTSDESGETIAWIRKLSRWEARERRIRDESVKPLKEVQLVKVQSGQSRSGRAGSECCLSPGDWWVRSVHSKEVGREGSAPTSFVIATPTPLAWRKAASRRPICEVVLGSPESLARGMLSSGLPVNPGGLTTSPVPGESVQPDPNGTRSRGKRGRPREANRPSTRSIRRQGRPKSAGKGGEQSYEPIVPVKVANRRAPARGGHDTHWREGGNR